MSEMCAKCKGDGWVCEKHPDKQWEECCGGAGIPCVCNDSPETTGLVKEYVEH